MNEPKKALDNFKAGLSMAFKLYEIPGKWRLFLTYYKSLAIIYFQTNEILEALVFLKK